MAMQTEIERFDYVEKATEDLIQWLKDNKGDQLLILRLEILLCDINKAKIECLKGLLKNGQ